MVSGTCGCCGQASELADYLAGLTVRCKRCGNGWISVPAPTPGGAPTASVTTATNHVSVPPKPPVAPAPAAPASTPPAPAAPAPPRAEPTTEPPPNLLASDYGLRPEPPEVDPWSPVRRWGVYILVLGAGSLVLPLFGLQFKLMEVFGDLPWIPGMVLTLIGAFLVAWTYWDRE